MTSTTTKSIAAIGKSEKASKDATAKRAIKAAIVQPNPCGCGCGGFTKTSRAEFVTGHDAKLRGVLLSKYDGGDTQAGRTLVARGWATEEGLVARGDKSLDANERKAATRDARIARLDAQIAALVAKRDAVAAEAV